MPSPVAGFCSASLSGIVLPGEEAGASVLVRLAGTSTPAAVFADSAYLTPLANPIKVTPFAPTVLGKPGLDARGTVTFYADTTVSLEIVVTAGPKSIVLPVHLVP